MHLLAELLLVAALAAAPARPAPAARASAAQGASSPRAYTHYLRARLAESAGDLSRAAEEMRSATAFDASSPTLRVALAELLARVGQVGRAEAEAHRAAALQPEGPAAWEAHLLLGRLAAMDRRPGVAARELRRSADLQLALARGVPAEDAVVDPEAWRLLARLQLEGGDEAGAERTLDELGTLRPGDAAASLRDLGVVALEQERLDRAEGLFRKAVALERRDVEGWRQIAQLAERRDRVEEARQAWEDLLREDDDDPEALTALARIALEAGDTGAARAWLDRMVTTARDEAAARASAAFTWLDAHRPADALAVVEPALAAGPEPRLTYIRGVALQELRRHGEAAEAFAAVRSGDPEVDAGARAARVVALFQSGRGAAAEEAADEALRANPGDARAQGARAWVMQRTGRTAEAVAYLRECIEKAGPRRAPPSLYEALASAQERAGDPAGALATMQALLARDPNDPDAMNYVAYTWAERGERLDEAERLVRRALSLRPGNAFFLDTLGWIHFRTGEFARAVGVLEQAARRAGSEATIHEHLGDAYRMAGRPLDAARAYRRALQALADGATPEPPDQQSQVERKLAGLPIPETSTRSQERP